MDKSTPTASSKSKDPIAISPAPEVTDFTEPQDGSDTSHRKYVRIYIAFIDDLPNMAEKRLIK